MAFQYIEQELAELESSTSNGSKIWVDFYKQLSELFRDSVTAQTVADYLSSLEDVHDDEKVRGTLWNLWSIIWEIAKKDDKVHQHLLDLLVALSRLPDVSRCHGMTVWRDLPIFHWEAREQYNFSDLRLDDFWENEELRAQKRSEQLVQRERLRLEYQNQNAFLARMTKLSHSKDIRPLNFDLYGLWTMREALEGGSPFVHQHSTMKRDGKTTDNPTHFDGAVPAAAQWIFHNGPGLFKSEEDFTTSYPRNSPGLESALWKGKHGFCKERWDLWQSRMGDVAEMQDVMERTREYAKEAYAKMKIISDAQS